MRVLSIDPGTTQSAWCLLDDDGMPEAFGIATNESVLHNLPACFGYDADELAIEMVASYGMPVGEEIFRTVWWTGRFAERWIKCRDMTPTEITRKQVAMHICHATRANDKNVRAALIDHFGGEGGRAAAIGTKKKPGPLYGIGKDSWSALAVALTAQARFQQVRAA